MYHGLAGTVYFLETEVLTANYSTRAVHHVGLLYTSHPEDVLKVKVFIAREDD